jgi:glycosyltransferase involved in cell wall biosynthesis
MALLDSLQPNSALAASVDDAQEGVVTILMATYGGELPDRLETALKSVGALALGPFPTVIVLDGPVGGVFDEVIHRFQSGHSCLTVVRLAHQGGLAAALNAGLPWCRGSFIARMDSDDFCESSRLVEQRAYLESHPEIDCVASWQAEFISDEEKVVRVKRAPAEHHEIVRAMRWRNVISHPSIMVRRSAIEKIGGYNEDAGLLEDYDLHMRMIASGAKYAVIQKPLVRVRVSPQQAARRGGWRYMITEWRLRYAWWKLGVLTFPMFFLTSCANSVWRLLPLRAKGVLYRTVRYSVPSA